MRYWITFIHKLFENIQWVMDFDEIKAISTFSILTQSVIPKRFFFHITLLH